MQKDPIVGVIGAGTMGMGIAQVAAQAGHRVRLHDNREGAVATALERLATTLEKLVAKGKFSQEQANGILGRIEQVGSMQELADCGLICEAIIEDLPIKKRLFAELDALVGETTILATNTSSLPITSIASACSRPERVVGMHFFNPAPVMKLVEVVPGMLTHPGVAEHVRKLAESWGKVPVVCKDTPGFIVNRVARPFYGESIRIHEEGIATMAAIDQALKQAGGFRMGPFELMDLIGNDINFAVTKSVWKAFFQDPRYKPSLTQQRQVESGHLGRKTGRGYYTYGQQRPPAPEVEASLAQTITERVLAMLINEAADAVFWGIASKEHIDLAMTKGVNYPKGLLAWADEQGAAHWLARLDELYNLYHEERYRASPLLRRMAQAGAKFY